ncbi:MAG: DUF692 domain-containing protein [Burkholderiales bacterium]|nr:DUF692 domain-containing protein [Burkholderiales bacterium]MDE2397384.1 DUF692 domain-containing protein [Burkholderiales bacterium]MDE2453650.1 DUF692 domain-containing protein [Burkholderiales bacterium]
MARVAPHCGSVPAGASGLPRRMGIGLKSQHFRDVLASRPDLGFFEVHAENYLVDGGPFHHFLGRIRERHALSLHGVGLSIGGEAALDEAHLARLARLVERYEPASFSEHLAWSSHGGAFLNDLLPLPYDAPTLDRVCRHIDRLQERLGRRILLENPATYVEFEASTMSETGFLRAVLQRTGCGLLLDLNNAYVSCTNHGRDAWTYIDELPLAAIGEVHLAGFARGRDGAGAPLLIDGHGSPVDEAVWALYGRLVGRLGPVPTLLERDNEVPPLPVLVAEASRAEAVMAAALPADCGAALQVPA